MKIGATVSSLTAAAVPALAGCGGDEDENGGAAPQRPARDNGARTTAVALKEFASSPHGSR